jgi:hypothetical protein
VLKVGYVDSREALERGPDSVTLVTRTWRVGLGGKSRGIGAIYQHPVRILTPAGRAKLILDFGMLSQITALLLVGCMWLMRRKTNER